MYTQLWETSGRESTKEFLSQSLHIYLMVGIPFTAIFILAAPDLLIFLASHRYGSGVSIIPYIATVILIDGALIFLSAGMYFLGSTNTILFWGVVAGLINFTGNYFIIPLYGIEGAAAVTMCAYIVFFSGILNSSLRLLMFPISWRQPLLMLVASVIVCTLLNRSYYDSALLNMIIKGVLSGSILLAILLTIDRDVRTWLYTILSARLARTKS